MSKDHEQATGAAQAPSEIDFFRAKSQSLMRQAAAYASYLGEDMLAGYDEADLQSRMKYVETLNADFNAAQTSLEKLDLNELASDTRANFNNLFFDLEAKLLREMAVLRRSSSNTMNSTAVAHNMGHNFTGESFRNGSFRKSRLPNLQLPQFGGEYADWPDFYAMFITVVDSDPELSNLEKYQYLRANLSGSALEAIRSLEPSDANYKKAIDVLINRFDNKLLHFQAHVRAIFGLQGVEMGSGRSLRELSDKMNSHLDSIRTLASTEEILDGFLIYIVESKLDERTRDKWEDILPTSKLPSWNSMKLFLEKRCRSLENRESAMCILWREDPSHELKAYKLDTVTYGTKPAAFLAIRAMHQLAFDEEHDFPIGAKIVRRDFYVDDLMSGGDTVDEVKEIRRQVKGLLLRGHFPIRKWCSNDPAALEGEPECDREKLLKLHDDTDFAKALGLVWNPSSDCLLFNFSQIIKATHFSKRSVLATIARFYDPLGILNSHGSLCCQAHPINYTLFAMPAYLHMELAFT
ncbi:hypothetical protein ACLKA6_001574 [Drosophila palustris]